MLEIVLAVFSILASFWLGEEQAKGSERRSANENTVRSIFQAVKNRFGISIDQLRQYAEKVDIRLNQLIDNTRGSARLSSASKILREYVQKYPELKKKIDNAINKIQAEMNNLDSKADERASQIQKRQEVSSKDILSDVVPSISNVNTTLTNINEGDQSRASNIDTTLTDNIEKQNIISRDKEINSTRDPKTGEFETWPDKFRRIKEERRNS